MINYAVKYKKDIDDAFLQKIPQEDRELVRNSSLYYIEPGVVKEGLKLLFNIDIDKFDDNGIYAWDYRSDVDAFVHIAGGGGYMADIIQQVVDYNELDNEINLTVVKAEVDSSGNVYRYVNNGNTLVYKTLVEDLRFTDENVDKFPQLKYVFRMNSDGKYYVSDIINLNFENDFEECNY